MLSPVFMWDECNLGRLTSKKNLLFRKIRHFSAENIKALLLVAEAMLLSAEGLPLLAEAVLLLIEVQVRFFVDDDSCTLNYFYTRE